MGQMLEIAGLNKSFGEVHAVADLSFGVERGETFGLLGPNGAGKTTTISMVCGLLAPDAGSIIVEDIPITTRSARGRDLIGYVPQEIALYPDLSGVENLRFFGRLYGLSRQVLRERIADTLKIVGLTERSKDLVKNYSGGMQRRLNIAAGMLHRPSLLILDEPTVGIDPQSRNAILDAVATLGGEGMSVVYTTHYMEEAERLCDRVAIMDHGRLLACGTRRELVALVGEQDTLRISVSAGAVAAASALESAGVVSSATASDDTHLTCLVDGAGRHLTRLLEIAASSGASIVDVAISEPSLDSVFMHITGTGLRD